MSITQESLDLSDTFIAHRTQLRWAAQKIVGALELAEEITQEAYIKVTDLGNALTVRQPVGYCFQVVRNLAIDHRRRQSLETNFFVPEEHGDHVTTTQGTPEQLAMSRQNLLLVDKVLSGLPARTRQAFEMHRLNGLPQRAIAQQLGVSATLVNFMVSEAMAALAECRSLLMND